MRDRTIRTIGASVVLAGLIVAGLIQVMAADDLPPVIEVAPSTTLEEDGSEPAVSVPSTSVETPFVYRIGILAAPLHGRCDGGFVRFHFAFIAGRDG